MKACGVDTGSHTTVMAEYKDKRVNIVQSETKDNSMPTMVAYSKNPNKDERSVGLTAKYQYKRNMDNTFTNFIRFLGLTSSS